MPTYILIALVDEDIRRVETWTDWDLAVTAYYDLVADAHTRIEDNEYPAYTTVELYVNGHLPPLHETQQVRDLRPYPQLDDEEENDDA